MAFRIAAALALVSLVSAGLVAVPAPAPQVYHQAPQEYHPAPQVYHPAPQVYHQAPQATYVSHAPAPVTVYKPAVQHVIAKQDEDFDPHPQYKFGYDVQDSVSGDSKSQVEERDGDVVRGEYSLIDADGFKRTVQYTADDHNGFNAVVNRVPLEHTHTVVKAAPVAYAAAAPHNYHH